MTSVKTTTNFKNKHNFLKAINSKIEADEKFNVEVDGLKMGFLQQPKAIKQDENTDNPAMNNFNKSINKIIDELSEEAITYNEKHIKEIQRIIKANLNGNGGKRTGAGRKKTDIKTVVMRVPEHLKNEIQSLIKKDREENITV